MRTKRTGVLLLALLACAGSLVSAARARAAFAGANGKLALERQDYSDSGVQFDNAPQSDAALLLAVAGKKPRALLSCTGGGDSDGECHAGADCPDSASDTTLCLDLGRPSFSPDGSTIAFADDTCKGAFCRRIAIVNADGVGEMLLPALTADDSQPAFLPTGSLVFSGRAMRKAIQNLYMVSANGMGLVRLTSAGGSEAAPCADGSIPFVHRGDVYLMSADHRSRRRLTFRGGSRPDCSPSGRWIAFVRHSDLYLISRSGRRLRRVTSDGAVQGAPTFSPDGKLLAFDAQHKPSKQWPPHRGRDDYSYYIGNAYLQVVDLRGREVSTPILLGNTGADQDGFGYGTSVGGVGWQPLPAPGSPGSTPQLGTGAVP
jgi:Dipeptidyl peptidase IV (DPP IV) N-terminal region/WD40-like Beta Propeller Repeat